MQRSYEKWYSPALGREMELLWFGWSGYPVIAFPTSMGRFFQYEDSGTVAALAHKLEAGQLQLCCVDSVDTESWYNEGVHPAARAPRHEAPHHERRRDGPAGYALMLRAMTCALNLVLTH